MKVYLHFNNVKSDNVWSLSICPFNMQQEKMYNLNTDSLRGFKKALNINYGKPLI